MYRGPCEAARVLAHDLAETPKLVGREVAAPHHDLDRGKAGLTLALEV
jgi:hypothetical protein